MKRILPNKYIIGIIALLFIYPILSFATYNGFEAEKDENNISSGDDYTVKIEHIKKLCAIYKESKNYPEAIRILHNGLKLSKDEGDIDNEANFELEIGIIKQSQNNYTEALKRMLWAEYLMNKSNNYYLRIKIYKSLSNQYSDLMDNIKALDYMLRANSLLKYIGNKKIKYIIYQNTANLYLGLCDYDSSLIYINKAKNILGADTTSLTYARLNITISDLFTNQEKDSIAILYLLKALNISKQKNNLELLAHISYGLSIAYMNQNRFSDSEYWILKALEYSNQDKDSLSKNTYYEQFALLKFNQGKVSESINDFEKVIHFYENQKLNYYLRSAYPLIITALIKKKQNNLSVVYYSKFIEVNSLINETKNRQLISAYNSKLQAEETLNDTIQDLELAKLKNKQLVSIIVFATILLALMTIGYYARKYYIKRIELTNGLLRNETKRKKAISDILTNDINSLLLPVSIFIAKNANDKEKVVSSNYSKVTKKLNQILSEVTNY